MALFFFKFIIIRKPYTLDYNREYGDIYAQNINSPLRSRIILEVMSMRKRCKINALQRFYLKYEYSVNGPC